LQFDELYFAKIPYLQAKKSFQLHI